MIIINATESNVPNGDEPLTATFLINAPSDKQQKICELINNVEVKDEHYEISWKARVFGIIEEALKETPYSFESYETIMVSIP